MRVRRRMRAGVLGSRSVPCSAPWRARIRPHFSRRQRWMAGAVMACARTKVAPASNLPAAMDRDQAAEHRLDAGLDETGVADHPLESRHVGKAPDRLDQI